MHAVSVKLNPVAVPAALGVAAVCAANAWVLTQDSRLMVLLPLAVTFVAVLFVFAELRLVALWLWAPLSVLTYPLGGPNVNITFNRIWIPAMLVLLLTLPEAQRPSRASSRLLLALGVLAAVFAIRTALTSGAVGDYAYGFRLWMDSLLLPLIIFAVVCRAVAVRAEAAERTALTMMIAGLFLACLGIAERILGFELGSALRGASVFFDADIDQVRISGPYESPAPYGLSLVLCLAATMYWLLMRRRAPETYLVGVVVVSLDLIAIFFNLFRVAWIGAIIVIVASLGLRPKRFGRAVATAALAAVVVTLGFTHMQAVAGVSTRVNETQTLYARLGAYEQATELFETKPIIGVGANRYHAVASQLPPVRVNGVESVPYAHNSFVQTLVEYGLIGFVALLVASLAIGYLIREFRRNGVSSADAVLGGALVGAAIAYLMYSLTLGMLSYGPSNQFFAAMLGIAAGRLHGSYPRGLRTKST
jgi:O-antigen ligase